MIVLNGIRAAKSTKDIKYLSWNFIAALKIRSLDIHTHTKHHFSVRFCVSQSHSFTVILSCNESIVLERKGWRTKWNGNICEVRICYSDALILSQPMPISNVYFTRVPFIHINAHREKMTILQLLYPLKLHPRTINEMLKNFFNIILIRFMCVAFFRDPDKITEWTRAKKMCSICSNLSDFFFLSQPPNVL